MHLTSRAPRLDDFDGFFHNCFHAARDDQALRGAVAHEWRVFLAHTLTLSLVVEDLDRVAGSRIVGCAQAVFVTDRFVRWARAETAPLVNRVAADRLPDGSASLLCPSEVRNAEARNGGLDVLVTRWGRTEFRVGLEDQRRVQEYMHRSFVSLARGYPFREMLMAATGAEAASRSVSAGFRLRTDYAAYYRDHPPMPPEGVRPYLMGITREEAVAAEGSLISHFFVYTPPRFGFTAEEQALLHRALAGATEKVTAVKLGVSEATVKNRWRALYDKVERGHPTLWALLEDTGKENEQRGKEKRRLLLNYLRDHPEELRLVHP